MTDNDDEQVLRRRIFELKKAEVKEKIEKLKQDRKELLGELATVTAPKIAGFNLPAFFAIVLAIVVAVVAIVLSVLPSPLKP